MHVPKSYIKVFFQPPMLFLYNVFMYVYAHIQCLITCTGYLVANIVESVVRGEARITRFRNMKVTAFILIVRVRT